MQLKKKKKNQQKNKTHTYTHTHQKWAKDLNGYFFKERIQIAIVQFSSVQSRPHRWQHTRLRRTWDSPGNTGVGCHFLFHLTTRTPGNYPQIPTINELELTTELKPICYSCIFLQCQRIFQAFLLS